MTADEDLVLLINYITKKLYEETQDKEALMKLIKQWRKKAY